MEIWQLPVQVKVHKENVRTKRETAEAYLEPSRKSKMELFAKMLTQPKFACSKLETLEKGVKFNTINFEHI